MLFVAACGGDDDDSTTADATTTEEATTEEATTEAAPEPVNLAFFPFSFDNVYIASAIDEYKTLVAENPDVTMEYFDAGFDTEVQLGQIRDATASGKFDGFIITPTDGVALIPGIEDAIAAGIEVICSESPCGPEVGTIETQLDGQLAFTSVNSAVDGELYAELAIEGCEGIDPCKVAFIQGFATNTNDAARLDAFNEGIADAANIEVVATVEGFFAQADAFKQAQTVLQANPDLNMFVTAGDQMTFGAQQAAEEIGLVAGEDILLIGGSAATESLVEICEGRWLGSTIYLPRTAAQQSLDIMVRTLGGEEGLGSVDTRDESPVGPSYTLEDCESGFEGEWSIGG